MTRAGERLLRAFYHASSGRRPSRMLGRFSDVELPRTAMAALVASYCRAFRVSLDDAVVPPRGFPTFDAFFTRRLRPGARPVDPSAGAMTSPSDGLVQSCGTVHRGMVLQAKGREYRLAELLGDERACERLEGGPYVTIYLSPRDYHRVHFPCDGEVTACRYAPGRLFTVAPRATRVVDRLFAQNERITTSIRTSFGLVAVVMVGAAGVGRISMTYGDVQTNTGCDPGARAFDPPPRFAKGDELGTFHLGSTVVMCVEPGPWSCLVAPGDGVRMGQAVLRRD